MLTLKPAVPAQLNAASVVCHAGAYQGCTHFLGWHVLCLPWNCWPEHAGSLQAPCKVSYLHLELTQKPFLKHTASEQLVVHHY